jgi:hypothetical protein
METTTKQSRGLGWSRLGRAVAIAGGTVAMALGILGATATPAAAQAAYGSYIGIGPAFGILDGDNPGQGQEFGAVISGRYRFLRIPVSVRSQVFLSDNSWAFVPTASYDLPLDWQTDVYLGAGFSLVSGSEATPIGDQSSFVLQPGIDHALPNSDFVLFGNAVIAFDGYEDGGTAASLQGGVGIQF